MSCSLPNSWESIFVAAAIGVIALPGLVVYIIILMVVVRNPSSFASNPYYKLLISHGIFDCTTVIIYLFYSVPCVFLQCLIFGAQVDRVLGTIIVISWFGTLSCATVTAVNRFWAVCRYATYNAVFSDRNSKLFVAIVWSAAIVCGIWQIFPCCGEIFWYDSYTWGYDTTDWNDAVFVWLDRGGTIIVTIVLIVSYAAIIRKPHTLTNVSSSGQQIRNEKTERRLALQFGIIGCVLCVSGLSFTVVPQLTTNRWLYLLLSELYLWYSICNPIIYLIFNSLIRRHVKNLLCGVGQNNVVAIANNNNNNDSTINNRANINRLNTIATR